MSMKTEAKSFHWDVALALVVVAAAMLFLPPLRKILLWPALGLAGVLAILLGLAAIRHKFKFPRRTTYTFTPPITAPDLSGATEIIRKSLADKINNLDWLPFEQLVTGLYTAMGYAVKRSGGPNADGGIDLVLLKNKLKTVAHCKHWKAAEVDEKELKEFLGLVMREKVESGIFVTAREFSFGARRFAAMNDLLLVGVKDLVRMLDQANYQKNPMLLAALDQSRKFCPRCEKDMVLRNAESGPSPGSRIWGCSSYPRCNYTVNA